MVWIHHWLTGYDAGTYWAVEQSCQKVSRLEVYGLEIVEQVPIQIPPNEINRGYMRTKKTKMGHMLDDI